MTAEELKTHKNSLLNDLNIAVEGWTFRNILVTNQPATVRLWLSLTADSASALNDMPRALEATLTAIESYIE